MVTDIYKVTRLLGLDPMECTVSGPISANPLLLLLITSALKLATPA